MADLVSLLSRRSILATMAGGAATVGTYAATNGGSGFSTDAVDAFFSKGKVSSGRAVKLDTAEVADWRAQIGTLFTLETGHVLKLGSVAEFADSDGPPPQGLRKKAFVARFDQVSTLLSRGVPEADRIYRVSHPQGGTFSIFLSAGDIANPRQKLAVFG
ncbi:hypothetical protein [Novosphingobium album (ex Liu et al. 2023)]|uniref:Uncharacterized protein n=1 Tax=Novosphingobium album (ex Liu et al. 2023) TaxID=3031130 RepID=A0ABT5WMN3_9SPHN|nr:hypothetical protein [Novosphingobium album (ex Liu et al. 2023)]MDE8651303.1 hypothetical protein [Novosphingobium album (ex Liu et al. 2023)]